MESNSKVNRYAKWTLILGIMLTLLFPFSIHLLNLDNLGKYGTVGDTIGGITAPISGLIGSILIYLALKAQLDANVIIQNQVNEDKKYREKDTNTAEFWKPVFLNKKFHEAVAKKFMIANGSILSDADIDSDMEEHYDEE